MTGPDDNAPVDRPDLPDEHRRVDPGTPELEHALFVVLGALTTLLVFLDAISLV